MTSINLLPQAAGPSKKVLKTSKMLRKVMTISGLVIFAAGTVMLAAFLFLTQESSTNSQSQANLISSIESLQETEQKLILVKDRLHKIQKIKSDSPGEGGVDELGKIVSFFPDGVTVEEARIIGKTIEIKLIAQNSDQLDQILSLLTLENYANIELSSINYSSIRGMNMSLKVII